MPHSPSSLRVPRPLLLVALALLSACTTTPRGPASTTDAAPESCDFAARFAQPAHWPAPNSIRTASGKPGPDYWQQRADYNIHATLDEPARTLTAHATITYTNNSPQPLSYLWLHLEQNLFSAKSDGALMTGPGDRFGNRDAFEGGIEILGVSSGRTSLGTPSSDSPLPLHIYDTLARLDLPEPIAANGGTTEFTIAWKFKVPPYGSDRMGISDVADGPVFQFAQWFPAIVKYDDVHGWNALPYLGTGEFYTDFGDYSVTLDVPAAHLVAATGVLTNPAEVLTQQQLDRFSAAHTSTETISIRALGELNDPNSRPQNPPRLNWSFRAENVRTFAWSSSSAFIWDACFLPGVGPSTSESGDRQGTLCQSFYPREATAWNRSTEYVRDAIGHYSRLWFPYPYPSATNVNGIVGGMEYPMVAYCGARDDPRGLWGVTTHELGHNWFPMIVANDERRHAWMDEGFNTFINYYHQLERYPDELPRRGHPRRWARENPNPFSQPVDTPADLLLQGTLGATQYAKTAAGLTLLREGILGEDRFDAAFKEYIHDWAFKSPRPWDFARAMENAAGMDLGWFWRGWFNSTAVLDQAVTTVMQPEGESNNARITFENRAGLILPVVYRVEYTDGSDETRRLPVQVWAQGDSWTTTWNTRGRKIKSVTLDPDEQFPDVNLSNNTWP
jgi:hypothetical protein